jgi:hypothetical protein
LRALHSTPAEQPYRGDDDRRGRIDLLLSVETPDAEPDRRASLFIAEPNRAQHV